MVPVKLSDSIEPEPSPSIWMSCLHKLTILIIQGALNMVLFDLALHTLLAWRHSVCQAVYQCENVASQHLMIIASFEDSETSASISFCCRTDQLPDVPIVLCG